MVTTLQKTIIARMTLLALLLTVFVGATALAPRAATAWNASTTSSGTFVGFNWDTYQYAYFPWYADSSIVFTKVWDNGVTYARIDSALHEVKTSSNWPAFSSYLGGYASTTYYSDSYYLYSWIYGSGGCLGPPWTYWFCAADYPGTHVLGQGRGDMSGNMSIGGDAWTSYGGTHLTGSFYFSY